MLPPPRTRVTPGMDTIKTDGVCVYKNIIASDLVEECIEDIWTNIVNLPWIPEKKKVWMGLKKKMEGGRYHKKLTREESKLGIENYPMTGSFGCLTLPPFFNLHTQWKVRENPKVVNTFRKVYNRDKLMVAIDRISFKLPGQGETEFCQWPFRPVCNTVGTLTRGTG